MILGFCFDSPAQNFYVFLSCYTNGESILVYFSFQANLLVVILGDVTGIRIFCNFLVEWYGVVLRKINTVINCKIL